MRYHFWKIIGLVAAFLALLWLLAPGSPVPPANSGAIKIILMASGDLAGDATDTAIREFEETSRKEHAANPRNPIYRVEIVKNPLLWGKEDPTRFLISVAGGAPPDVVCMDRQVVGGWAERGVFEPLDRFIARDLADGRADAVRQENFYKPAWQETVCTGAPLGRMGVYGIPMEIEDYALVYNKDLLKSAGYMDQRGEVRPPRTWEELVELTGKLTRFDGQGHLAQLGYASEPDSEAVYFYALMNRGEFMSFDGKRCMMNTPRIIETLNWMSKTRDAAGGTQKEAHFLSGLSGGVLEGFALGRIAMMMANFRQVTAMTAQWHACPDFGVVPPPVPSGEIGRKPSSWIGGNCLAMPAATKHKGAAWSLIRFLSGERTAEIMATNRLQTANNHGKTLMPPFLANRKANAILFKSYVEDNPGMDPKLSRAAKVFYYLLDNAMFRNVLPSNQEFWSELKTATQNVINKKMETRRALDQAARNFQNQMDSDSSLSKGMVLNWETIFGCGILILALIAVVVFLRDARPRPGSIASCIQFRSQWGMGFLCALPWMIGFLLFIGGPLLFSLLLSFCELDAIRPIRFIGLGNYIDLFTKDPLFWKSAGNTLFMLCGLLPSLALSFAMALLLNQRVRGVAVWRMFFFLPAIMPVVASCVLWFWMFNPFVGSLNAILAAVGLHGPDWLGNESTSKFALIIMGLWSTGSSLIVWLAGLESIDKSCYEAALMDGAGWWQRLIHLTLPALAPHFYFNLAVGIAATLRIFSRAFIMTGGGPSDSTLFYTLHWFNKAFLHLCFGQACAMGWMLFLASVGLAVPMVMILKRWLHYEK